MVLSGRNFPVHTITQNPRDLLARNSFEKVPR